MKTILAALFVLAASFGFTSAAPMTKDCPVTGKGTSRPVEYKKSVSFCSAACKAEFDKNPTSQIEKIAAFDAKAGKCPMCSKKADPKVTSEFKATIGVCCNKCVAKFSADPDKYVVKALKN